MCAGTTPDIDTCLRDGLKLSQWFAERILNPERMCDWGKGTCGSLFGEGEGESEKEKEKEKDKNARETIDKN